MSNIGSSVKQAGDEAADIFAAETNYVIVVTDGEVCAGYASHGLKNAISMLKETLARWEHESKSN